MSAANVNPGRSLVVAGDVMVDWAQVLPHSAGPTGLAHPQNSKDKAMRMVCRPGGALLLANLVKARFPNQIHTYRLMSLEKLPPSEGTCSFLRIENDKDQRGRVMDFLGFSIGKRRNLAEPTAAGDIVYLFDANLEFRQTEEDKLPDAIGRDKKPLVIFRTVPPYQDNPLFEYLCRHHSDRLLVVINIDDLRQGDVLISSGLSWESTLIDFKSQILNDQLKFLAQSRHLLVRLGLDAIIHHQPGHTGNNTRIFYHSDAIEGQYSRDFAGTMSGFRSVFCASIAESLISSEPDKQRFENIDDNIKRALAATRLFLRFGYGEDFNIDESQTIFRPEDSDVKPISVASIPDRDANELKAELWSFASKIGGDEPSVTNVAMTIVRLGGTPSGVPMATYGALTSIDRSEIESYRKIRNSICEFLAKKETTRPLSLAVFGRPGTGKSFGITEIARSLEYSAKIKPVTFNVAQFTSFDDLAVSFHRIRDIVLEGDIPLAFFDEFDLLGRQNLWVG